LPVPSGLPDNAGFSAMQARAWSLLWPVLVATILAGVTWQIARLRK